MNQIIQMIGNQLIKHGLGWLMGRITSGGKTKAEMTPEEREQAKQSRQMAKRMRQATKIGRRLG